MRLKDIFRNLNFMFIFFGLFVYFMFIFDPSLYYHHHQPIFLFTHFFLKEFLFYPGGFIEWIMQFILQFFYFKWLGSLILAICVTSIFFIIFKLFKKLRYSKYTLVLSFLPIILLLILQNNYNFPVLITFKYLVVLLLFLIYKISQKQFKIMVILFSTVIYYILGGWFFLFYTLICILYELLFIKEPVKYLYTVLNAAMYLICPYIGSQYLFMITREEAYLYMVPYEFYYPPFTFKPNFYFFSFFLSLPVLLTIIFIYGRYIRLTFKSRKNKLFSILNHPLAQPVFIILIAGLIVNFSFNKQEKYKIQIDRCADQGQWQELLELAQKTTEYDREINFTALSPPVRGERHF